MALDVEVEVEVEAEAEGLVGVTEEMKCRLANGGEGIFCQVLILGEVEGGRISYFQKQHTGYSIHFLLGKSKLRGC